MKVIFDANVLLSFILAPDPNQTVAEVVRICYLTAGITVLTPAELIQEVQTTALTKRYFRNKVSPETLSDFLATLITYSEIPPPWQGQIQRYTRDHKDDYLVAYALFHDVDYLVSGDRHLLALKQIDQLKILLPSTMLEILQSTLKIISNPAVVSCESGRAA